MNAEYEKGLLERIKRFETECNRKATNGLITTLKVLRNELNTIRGVKNE